MKHTLEEIEKMLEEDWMFNLDNPKLYQIPVKQIISDLVEEVKKLRQGRVVTEFWPRAPDLLEENKRLREALEKYADGFGSHMDDGYPEIAIKALEGK